MTKETNATVDYGVSRVIAHPRHYATSGSPGDIAILVLDRPVQLSNSVKPVCLPISDEIKYEGMVAVSAGWGVTEDGETSDVLRQVKSRSITHGTFKIPHSPRISLAS